MTDCQVQILVPCYTHTHRALAAQNEVTSPNPFIENGILSLENNEHDSFCNKHKSFPG